LIENSFTLGGVGPGGVVLVGSAGDAAVAEVDDEGDDDEDDDEDDDKLLLSLCLPH
jgi:hypothetical protein